MLKANDNGTRPPEDIIARLNEKLQNISGIVVICSPHRIFQIGARMSRRNIKYTLADLDPAELSVWAENPLRPAFLSDGAS